VMIDPARAFAFGSPAPRSTENTPGATAALKKTAAPSQRPSSNNPSIFMNLRPRTIVTLPLV
jgi:hypothetical protein